ncbi:MAG: LysR family transcriptional regulator [Candidatus Omnitrophica bacterium]|nr:LysR family transcriptional regulator [Candidatus Omnitrophota bacterium]
MIRSLRLFRDLVQTQSFTETAHRNYLTQSAVSHHLKTLEQQFGHRLIERGRKQVRLTRAGVLLLEAGKDILGRYEQLERSLKEPTTEVAGPLRVGSIYTVGLYELPGYTTAFLKRYPKVNLLLTYLKNSEIYEAVLTDQIEIGIVEYPKPHPQLAITPFIKERVVLIVPPRHPWATKSRIRLAQLHAQPFIVPQAEFPVDEILRKTKIRVRVVHAFDNIEITKRAVEVNLGLALVPRVAVLDEVRYGKLKALDLSEGPFERPIGLLVRKRAELTLPARKFIDLLVARSKVHARHV